MSFIIVKKGTRPSASKIYISTAAKTINFTSGFLRSSKVDLTKTRYIRLAYDNTTKEIALDFPNEKINESECLTLTPTQTKTSASCSINPILTTFSVGIREIAGTYKDKAIEGPLKINGFSENGYILRPSNREV
jgi:hypothetical protein